MNKTILIGRLTKNPEIRYTSNNVPCCTFTLAVSRDFTNQNGEREADFINIQVWKNQAENCSKYLTKGSLIGLLGRIQTRSYDNEKGEKRYVTEVVADNVKFLDNKKDGQQSGQVSATQSATESDTQVPQNEFENMSVKTGVQQQLEYTEDDLPW